MKTLLVGTSLEGLDEVRKLLDLISTENNLKIEFCDLGDNDPLLIKSPSDVLAMFVNPNYLKRDLNQKVLQRLKNLKVICTASTGTVHIDKQFAAKNNIEIISITNEKSTLEKIPSTAELAWLFTMMAVRPVIKSHNEALKGEWDFRGYIGHQIKDLNIGVIGLGRLGTMYSGYANAFGANVLHYELLNYSSKEALRNALSKDISFLDIVSLHIHAEDNQGFIDEEILENANPSLRIINTSRGEVIDRESLFKFLTKYEQAKYFTDVIDHEADSNSRQEFLKQVEALGNIFITQHIGGMTYGARSDAYYRAAELLHEYCEKNDFN